MQCLVAHFKRIVDVLYFEEIHHPYWSSLLFDLGLIVAILSNCSQNASKCFKKQTTPIPKLKYRFSIRVVELPIKFSRSFLITKNLRNLSIAVKRGEGVSLQV